MLLFVTVTFGVFALAGCASTGMLTPPSPTNVVVLLTSTANDKLVEFGVTIASISLSGKEGNSVLLYNNPNAINPKTVPVGPGEFMHLNGASEPLVTMSVPQGVYTAATVEVGGCDFTIVWIDPSGNMVKSNYSQGLCDQGTGNTTVNLPSPITISGPIMALSLNLQVAQSYTLNGTGASAAYTISPVFSLTPVLISSHPTNQQNGKVTGIDAQITSINAAGNGLMMQTTDGISLNVKTDSNTLYQGVAGFSTLAVGTLVDTDLAIQPDGSLLATRVEVDNISEPTLLSGPATIPGQNPGEFLMIALEVENCFASGTPYCSGVFQPNANTLFAVSGQFSNLQSLPFAATFTGSTFFPGQNVSVFTPGTLANYETVTTLTLMPQTLNGVVTAVSTEGGLNVYAVALASYDLIPTLQTWQVRPIVHVNSPNVITVYADANSQVLSSSPLKIGGTFRFRGLIFDDNGNLRMDCGQMSDGVPE